MIIKDINSYYFVHHVKEHNQYKEKLLSLIEQTSKSKIDQQHQNIYKTDWNIDSNTKREYVDTLYEMLTPYLLETAKFFYCEHVRIIKSWFQQYTKNNFHDWHTHPDCNYSSVYYLELKDSNMKTEILDYKTKSILKTTKLKEGDFIIFPSYLLHRSPINKSNNRKSIFSLNLNFVKSDNIKI